MIDNNDDDINSLSEQRKSQQSQSSDNQQDSINIIRCSEDSTALKSQINEVILINSNNSNTKPEASYSSLHDGLSSPQVTESLKMNTENEKNKKVNESNCNNNSIINNHSDKVIQQQKNKEAIKDDKQELPQQELEIKIVPEPIVIPEVKKEINYINSIDTFIQLNPKEELIDDNEERDEDISTSDQKKTNIISLYENILNGNLNQISQPFYLITVKEKVKDMLIGFHIVYEISYYHQNNNQSRLSIDKDNNKEQEKVTKCYRRYDNFDKLYKKLKRKYPYIMIPKLTPKKFITKVTSFNETFFENRRLQLIFFLNFITKHPTLLKSKALTKFLNDANFDDAYFAIIESPIYALSLNSSPSELIKSKLITMWNSIGPSITTIGVSTRKMNDSEILINKMTTHYKNIQKKYDDIKLSITDYIKTIKNEAIDYKSLSETLYYIKDSFDSVEGSKEKLSEYSQFSMKISNASQTNHIHSNRLQNKIEALISLLEGISYSFNKYSLFIKEYYDIITAKLASAKESNWDNINEVVAKYDQCEILKNIFDKTLTKEANAYIELFDESSTNVLEQFKALLMKINTDILD